MIHYITVGVALQRPPEVHQYRRYAIYGGTHADAELTALQMAACTSVMPVEVQDQGECYGEGSCAQGGPITPHGAVGCRCWNCSDEDTEGWLVDDHCPHHGTFEAATPAAGPSPPEAPDTPSAPVAAAETCRRCEFYGGCCSPDSCCAGCCDGALGVCRKCCPTEEESKCNSASPRGRRIRDFLTRVLKRSRG